ncbi:hypothetical protein BDQ94DRAFT_135747, partial [Aspergillus welwitschiae]
MDISIGNSCDKLEQVAYQSPQWHVPDTLVIAWHTWKGRLLSPSSMQACKLASAMLTFHAHIHGCGNGVAGRKKEKVGLLHCDGQTLEWKSANFSDCGICSDWWWWAWQVARGLGVVLT